MSTSDPNRRLKSLVQTAREAAPPSPPPPNAVRSTREQPAALVERSATSGRGTRISMGILIFLGSLLGSLLGVAADLGQAAETVEQVRDFFNPVLCVAGSNTVLGDGIDMAVTWAQDFDRLHDVRVEIRGVGSVNGVQEAAEGGCVHVLAMSEELTDAQYLALTNAGVQIDCAAEIGYDVLAFVGDNANQVPALLARDLRPVLLGGIDNWSQVGGQDRPIRILARPGSGTTDYVLINVARWVDPNIYDDVYFPPDTDYLPCSSNDGCLNRALSTPGSLYWVSVAWMKTQPEEYIRVIPILSGDERYIDPLREDVDLNEYYSRLIRPLYMYVLNSPSINADQNRLAREWLDYVRSVQGQQILEQFNFYTFFRAPRAVPVNLPPGFGVNDQGLRPTCRT